LIQLQSIGWQQQNSLYQQELVEAISQRFDEGFVFSVDEPHHQRAREIFVFLMLL